MSTSAVVVIRKEWRKNQYGLKLQVNYPLLQYFNCYTNITYQLLAKTATCLTMFDPYGH